MIRSLALAALALFLSVSPAGAGNIGGSLQFWEDSLGSPGVTAEFSNGTGLFADIDFDAGSAEGGNLGFGASEITIVPLGDLSFVSFGCELKDCFDSFTPGGEGVGQVQVTDGNPDFNFTGIFDLGTIGFDAASGTGQIQLSGCNYSDANFEERSCAPFTLVTTVPEPGSALLLAMGLGALAGCRLIRRSN